MIRRLKNEVEKSPNNIEEKRKAYSLLQRIEYILTSTSDYSASSKFSKLKSWVIHYKWLFIITSPFIMKIIELIEYMVKYSQSAPGEDV